MKKIILLILPSLIFSHSCKKGCESPIHNIYQTGVSISAVPITASQSTDEGFDLIVEPTGRTEEEALPKNCNSVDLLARSQIVEYIDTGDISVYCNKDFYVIRDNNNGTTPDTVYTIPKGSSFLTVESKKYFMPIVDTLNNPFIGATLRFYKKSTPKEVYTFYVSGTTSEGNSFMDSTTINFN